MVHSLIFAGGVGKRMHSKSLPKQFLEVHGKPILVSTIEHFETHTEVDDIYLVCGSEWKDYACKLIEKYNIKKVKALIDGGATALESQYNGLKEIIRQTESMDDIVLIHDGVRPLINEKTISDCISAVRKYGSAITVAPATETIVQAQIDTCIMKTFPRSECYLARAPQCFWLSEIFSMHERARLEHQQGFVDSCSLMLHYNYELYPVLGPVENIKVTTPADFYVYKALLDARESSQIFGI